MRKQWKQWKTSYDQLDSILKSRDIANKGPSSQGYGFSSSHVWIWQVDHKESWEPKNWCFWTGVGEDSWESLGLQDQSSQSLRKSVLNIHQKDWCWSWSSKTGHLMRRTDSLEKTLLLGKAEGGRRRGWGWEDEMVGWHHRLDGYEFEQALGVVDGQGSLACYSPWGCKESGIIEWLNWTDIYLTLPTILEDTLIKYTFLYCRNINMCLADEMGQSWFVIILSSFSVFLRHYK